MTGALARAAQFCDRFALRVPILLAPMAGVPAPALSVAIANAGGLAACGVLLLQPSEIVAWVHEFRAKSQGVFQLNAWIPDPPPARHPEHEARIRAFLSCWGPAVPPNAGGATPPDFAAQCETMLNSGAPILSSVMGVYPPEFVRRLKAKGIAWFANVSTVREARLAQAAGADVVVAQGAEAGGHRGCFDAAAAEREMVGLFALIPAVADAVTIPVVATGGIADARGIAAAFALGASAVQVGTASLRSPEAAIDPAWSGALAATLPEQAVVSRAFSGRAGRSVATDYVLASLADDAPRPAPYPVQRDLTARMRAEAQTRGDVQRMQAWAGQSAALAQDRPAADLIAEWWTGAQALLA
jgi:nitronate monooxygenase